MHYYFCFSLVNIDLQRLIPSVSDCEQRSFIKICILLDKTPTFIHGQLSKALLNKASSLRTVQTWVKDIKEGRVSVEDTPRSGRPITARTDEKLEQLKSLLADSNAWSHRELAYRLDTSKGNMQRMLKEDLGLVKKLTTWVPHTLTQIPKESREDSLQQS
jgi:hypothetical protein